MKKLFKKIPRIFYTAASLSSLAAINYTLIHTPLVFLFIFVLLIHELGHYFTAKIYKADASLPIFIPLPFLAIAFTRIKELNSKLKARVSIAGPLYAITFALLLILNNHLISFTSSFILFLILFGEIVFNYFGSDGSKYRQAKKEMAECIL